MRNFLHPFMGAIFFADNQILPIWMVNKSISLDAHAYELRGKCANVNSNFPNGVIGLIVI